MNLAFGMRLARRGHAKGASSCWLQRLEFLIKTSFLTLTFATHLARAYNNKYDLLGHGPLQYHSEKYWKERGDCAMLTEAITKFRDVLRATDWAGGEFWFAVWWNYDAFNHYYMPDDGADFGADLKAWMERLGCRVAQE
jgi:hypothetical protein